MAKRRPARRQSKSILDELADLFAWWGRRQKKVAARRRKRAQALKDRNDAAEQREQARQLKAAERQRHAARVRAKRAAAAQRAKARIAAAGPVVKTVGVPITVTQGGGQFPGGQMPQQARPCGQRCADGTPCQRPVLPGTTDCGVDHRKVRGRP